jgi:predicted amino acid dehydrogenase
MADVAATVLRASAEFAHLRLGAQVLGLGAILPHPTITNFGRRLHALDGMADLVTTTGHGGTVYMIVSTVKKILRETSIQSRGRIGVLGGAGSIGWSTTVAALEMVDGHEVYSYDTRVADLTQRAKLRDVVVASSVVDVLRNSNIIVAAVTGTIDLDGDEFKDLDLDGKVIIDDSQPGCFDRDQVEARGGKLVWVVGEDGSDSEFITRDGLHTDGVPYNYGDYSGLYGRASEFACGQEAAVIAQHGAYDRAITGPVTPENVREIGELFEVSGVRVAPFQAYGRPVRLV